MITIQCGLTTRHMSSDLNIQSMNGSATETKDIQGYLQWVSSCTRIPINNWQDKCHSYGYKRKQREVTIPF